MTNEMPEHLLALFTGAFLFRACSVFLSAPHGAATSVERERWHDILNDLLDAARAGGFEHSDELDARVLAGERLTWRLVVLAQIGSHFIADRVSRTGGSARALVQNSAVGGALGMGAFSNPAAAVFAVPTAAGLNAALGSPSIARATLGPGLQSGSAGSMVRRAAPVVASGSVSTDTRPLLSTFGGGGASERPVPAKTVNGVPVSRFWGD